MLKKKVHCYDYTDLKLKHLQIMTKLSLLNI